MSKTSIDHILGERKPEDPYDIAIFSGGLDSTTMVYALLDAGRRVDLVSFNYGQRHKKELEYAALTAAKLHLQHDIIDLSGLTHLISNSALTLGKEVPDGHYAEENMKQTVVPNRNMIMLAIAGGIAVNRGASTVATAVHAGDHFIYPDCRPGFMQTLSDALRDGNKGFGNLRGVQTPYIYATKADIAEDAMNLNVPLEDTWSCYKGGDRHCGRCGTCVERLEAINEASNRLDRFDLDNTQYEDTTFWKEAVANA